MLRDVFYYGDKPNVHPREKFAKNFDDARSQATTADFWIVNEYCDYNGFDWDFDFEFLHDDDVWAEDHINVWPSQHQKDSGTWLCNTDNTEPLIIYRADIEVVKRKNIKSDRWSVLHPIDELLFDYSWHPDPSAPPYIYVWGNQWHSGTIMPTVEYHTSGASDKKYIENSIAILAQQPNKFNTFEHIDHFDYSWVPNPTSPPFVYAWGNQWNDVTDRVSVQYVVDDATEYKYMTTKTSRLSCMDNWEVPAQIDASEFDYSWEPSPAEPPFIYQFGTQWQKTGGPRYVVEGATEVKFVDTQKIKALATTDNWTLPTNIDVTDFDFSWHPDDTSPPYIYVFPTQWALSGGPIYTVEGATEIKYVEDLVAKAVPDKTNWEVPAFIDEESFDFSWHPYAEDEPYIYQFGTQHQKTGGPVYKTPSVHANSSTKYIDTRILKAKRLPSKKNFAILDNIKIKDFDYSWHPDTTDEPYIYVFGNTQYPAEIMPTVEYTVPGATQIKYVNKIVATLSSDTSNWEIPTDIDTTDFDFSWKPNPKDPNFIYQFGTQWQKTGGPRYVMPDATDIKYIDFQKVTTLPNKKNWISPSDIEHKMFDYSWHPDSTETPYIYQFGTQWQKTGGPRYIVEGATEIKYVDTIRAIKKSNKLNWHVPAYVDEESFDFSWHPDSTDDPFNYEFTTVWQSEGGPVYQVEDATETKYVTFPVAKTLPVKSKWTIPANIDVTNFDFSWHPHPRDPAFIYQFGTQWQKTSGPRYVMSDATIVKYIDDLRATTLARPNDINWQLPENIEISEFDYSWHPDDTENIPYIYVFGTQWALSGGPKYVVPGATVVKYVEEPVAIAAANRKNWVVPDDIDSEAFDFSWHPYAEDEPYIYQFGTQWQASGGPKYIAPECNDMSPIKYIDTRVLKAKKLPNFTNWVIPSNVDRASFDFSWQPGVEDKPYIYQFGTQWQKTGGPRYVMPGAEDIKFVAAQKATVLPDRTNWVIPNGIDVKTFDFSWHPDSTSPKYVYQFGTIIDPNDGPRYLVPGTDGEMINLERVETTSTELVCSQYFIETTLEDLISKHPTELFWALNPDLDYSNFDFTWRPSIEQANYVHAFGSEDNINTQTYFVNAILFNKGFTEINYVEGKMEIKTKIDMFFVDRGNAESKERFEQLQKQFPDLQKTRYLNTWVDTINRCINRSTTTLCWIINSELDYTDFDFNYYPNPWQMKMIQVFGTQWSHWGTTFMVNRETFAEDTKHIKVIEHLSNLNFLKERRATATNILYDTVTIDHGNMGLYEAGKTIVKYEESYFNTFKKLLDKLPVKKEHYIWITSSVCDYSKFDFTYICDPFARDQLHVFPSDKQKFGDTFLVNVNKLRELISDMESLEDYEKINYNQHQRTKRLAAPVIVTEGDTHVSSIDSEYNFPYATFVTRENKDIQVIDTEPMNLWKPETKNIIVTSTGGTRITMPKEAKDYVKRELYDYPYIITNTKLAKSSSMDIVFLSNGETGANENYEHLLRTTHGLDNRVVRVDGVNGRVAAYHAAALASNTAWMFTVFAKLKVSNKFDWNWQPDRLQIPKHYVFHAKNPVNGLVYGHQAMIAYNKKLTLANEGKGLDFTMDDEHEVVEVNSGIAVFNTDAWSTWRTAFREALKLRANTDEVSKNRLEMWLTVGMGKFNEYSMDGAQHAVEYYDSVNGDFDKLKLSYEWEWLRAYYNRLYPN